MLRYARGSLPLLGCTRERTGRNEEEVGLEALQGRADDVVPRGAHRRVSGISRKVHVYTEPLPVPLAHLRRNTLLSMACSCVFLVESRCCRRDAVNKTVVDCVWHADNEAVVVGCEGAVRAME